MLLTTRAAAERLGLTQSRVLKLIRGGRLPAEKLGRDWLVNDAELERFAVQPRSVGYPKGRARSAG